jgi:hypothetical protein
MTARKSAMEANPGHALNNLLGKILGAAELALDRVTDPQAQAHLETIMALAEAGGEVVHAMNASRLPTGAAHPHTGPRGRARA